MFITLRTLFFLLVFTVSAHSSIMTDVFKKSGPKCLRVETVILVNPVNPIEELTRIQAYRLYSGKTKTWNDLGLGHIPVTLYVSGSGVSGILPSSDALHCSSLENLVQAIALDPTAIGFATRICSIEKAKALKEHPDTKHVIIEDYD